MATFHVVLKKTVDDSYPIEIGENLWDTLTEELAAGIGIYKKFAVITDDIVEPLYALPVCRALRERGFTARLYVIPNGEKSKTREMKARIEDQMLADGFRRDCCVVAIGGGVVTDLGGFIAGTFARGVPFVNAATTILAAADASVGGKTAVDTPLATNLIGLFYQPKKVYIDLTAWKTLPMCQIQSGLAETIKHACLADRVFFDYLEEHMEEILALEKEACAHIAQENCRIKYRVIMQDERESGLREVLNLGHTVGRAIETVSDYRLLHGEAVAIGLTAQAKLAERLGYMTKQEADRVIALLHRAGLPTVIPDYIDRKELVRKLYTDKKVKNGCLRFVLMDGIGAIKTYAADDYAHPIPEELAAQIITAL